MIRGAAVAAVTLALASPALAGEERKEEPARYGVTGLWSCVQKIPGGGERPFLLRLEQQGEKLTGRVTVSEGDAPVTGTVESDGFKLEVVADVGTYQVAGKVEGDRIGGTWALAPGTAGTWEGQRKGAN
jgi:hypothetical protein